MVFEMVCDTLMPLMFVRMPRAPTFPSLPTSTHPFGSQERDRENKRASRRVLCSTWVKIKMISMLGNTISTLDLHWMRIAL